MRWFMSVVVAVAWLYSPALRAADEVAGAPEEKPVSVPWDKLTSGQKSSLVWTYAISAHQLPTTFAHEGSHWLAAQAFGGRPKLTLMPSWVSSGGSQYLAGAYVEADEKYLNRTEQALITIAPFVTKLLVVDRLLEAGYRGGHVHAGSFGDRYLLAQFQLALTEPATGIFAQSDLGQFAKLTGIPRIPLAIALQAAYAYSYIRIVDARNGPFVPVLYIHFSF